MDENKIGQIRLRRVSQTASVRRERAATRTTRPRVVDNSFDDASNLHPRGSHPYVSHIRLSQAYDATYFEIPEAPEAQKEAAVDAHLESYP